MDFINSTQYFTLFLFIQNGILTQSFLYNKLLGNTYVKSSPHLHYFDSSFPLICTFSYRQLQYSIIKYLVLYNKYEITIKSFLPWIIIR